MSEPNSAESRDEAHLKPPIVHGMLEYGLYVEDVSLAVEFYQDLFGFSPLFADSRMVALDVEGVQVLLLFKHGASRKPITTKVGVEVVLLRWKVRGQN